MAEELNSTSQHAGEQTTAHPPKRHRVLRVVSWTLGSLLVLLLVVLAGAAYYTTTPDFQRRVGKQVVSILDDSTGGRTELGHISFNLWHLAIEADGLVIHGLEGPGEAPYLSADKILVRVKIISFLQHTAGGVAGHIGLNLLRVEQPHVHLIIDKQGKTNQPVPKHPTQSNKPVLDTLLDLKAQKVELVNGLAVLNDKAVPFNLAARDLQAEVHYLASTDRYGATIDLNDLRTQMQKEPEAQSKLHLTAEVGRDMAQLTDFEFHSGAASNLKATASLENFKQPKWQAKLDGSLELKQISLLAGVDGLDAGSVDLDLGGHNCYVTPQAAQKHPKFWDRHFGKQPAAEPAAKVLPPDPSCEQGYLLVGSAKLHGAAYKDQYVQLHDINGGAQLHITPTQLLFTALTGYLPGGGSATGELKIDNWLGEVPANTTPASATVKGATTTANKTAVAVTGKAEVAPPSVAPVARAHAYLTVTVDHIPVPTILDITATKPYRDIGFNTSITGPVKVEWGGPVVDIADSVLVDADLKFAPVKQRYSDDIPVSGQLVGHYDGKTETVLIKNITANTLSSTLTANGVLGVNLGDPLTALNVDLQVRRLSEFDPLLRDLGLTANGKQGAAAIPINLKGSAAFHGTARGAIAKLDVKGHLEANDLDVRLGDLESAPVPVAASRPNLVASALGTSSTVATVPPAPAPVTDVHIDSLVADAEYNPSGLSVGSSTIRQGTAVLNLAGTFKPRTVIKKRQPTYVWDGGTQVNAKVGLAQAQVGDLLTIAGQQQKIPVTGTINLNAQVAGTFKALNGSGTVSLVNGVAYGEPYEAINVDATVQGQQIEASRVQLRLHGMSIAGNGGYNLASERLHAHIAGNNLQLSKFKTVQDAKVNADGVLSLTADANGTLSEPNLKANLQLANLTADGKALGQANVEAHSQGKLLYYTASSTLVGASIQANGQTELAGNYQTSAHVSLSGLDIAKPLALFQPGGLQATSNIAGTIDIAGPAKTPTALAGKAVFQNFSVTSQGLTFAAAEPLAISLRNGIATLDAVHVKGPDTDLRASGTAQVFGAVNAKGQPDNKAGRIDVKATGSVSAALAHTFDPDLITSGRMQFAVGAGGTLGDPTLNGDIVFQNVNASIDGVPNGLSNLNGKLVFNQDRLNVESLTAITGGGILKIGGFLTYRGGIYADLSASGNAVRVRYNGLSGTANINVKLQGGPQSALLSGSVLLTRFGIGADVDFAQFAGAGGVSAPPDPNAAANKIRMDVHVTSSPQLDFQNSYAKLAGTVDLNVRGTVADPSILGRIQITDGSATFAGTTYELQRGNIYFSNPVRIDPTIDLDATARVENYDITVGVHGTATNFKPTYRSEPPLSEPDIFALLALGRTQEESQLYQEQQVQAGTDPTTSSLLGGALNATLSSRASKLFGSGGSVKIDPNYVGTIGNSSARITVQKQLSRQLAITYATNVNSSSAQLIQLQYNLTPTRSIVIARDENDVFSIVFKLHKRYR